MRHEHLAGTGDFFPGFRWVSGFISHHGVRHEHLAGTEDFFSGVQVGFGRLTVSGCL